MTVRETRTASSPKRRRTGASPVSIKEVARLAGVSLGTVSHVLNHPEIVRESLRERVLKVIEESGYRPNAVAKSLRQGKTKTIGLVLSDITTSFAGRLARAVEEAAAAADMSVVFSDTDEGIDREERAVHVFIDKGVDGLILAPAPGSHKFLEPYLARGVPMIAVNRMIEDVDIPAVLSTNFEGAAEATRHLVEHGHRRIGIVSPSMAPLSSMERLEGYRHAIERSGIAYEAGLIAEDDWSDKGGFDAAMRLVRHKQPPTAVISLSSVMTLGIIRGLREAGMRIPEDIALIGFDETAWSAAVTPALTSIDLKADLVGKTATQLLLDWIGGKAPKKQRLWRVPTELLLRESCGCMRKGPAR